MISSSRCQCSWEILLEYKKVLWQNVLLAFQFNWCFSSHFCLSTLPKIDQSETSRQLSSKSDDFRPIRELFLSQVAIIVQSESSCHHMWRLSTNQRALDTNKQLTSVTKNTIMVFKIKKILWDLSRKMQSTFLYSTWISLEHWHLEDEINCHQFQVFLKIWQILKTRYYIPTYTLLTLL